MANRLGIVLQQKGIRQEALADYLGVTSATVSRWSTNSSQPPVEKLFQAANYLHVDITNLLYGEAVTLVLPPSSSLSLSELNSDDAYLKLVSGTDNLEKLQLVMLVFDTELPDKKIRAPLSLMGYTNLNRPTNIAVIEVGENVSNCRRTIVSAPNCNEELRLTFLRPSKT